MQGIRLHGHGRPEETRGEGGIARNQHGQEARLVCPKQWPWDGPSLALVIPPQNSDTIP